MIIGKVFSVLGGVIASLVVFLVSIVAWVLSPFRIGRMLQTTSIPRLREHGLRTTLTVFGIALGVAVLVAVLIVNRSIISGVAATVDDVAGRADLQLSAGSTGFDETLVDTVRGVPGVAKLTPVLQQTVAVREGAAKGERLLMLGIDFLGKDDEYFRNYASGDIESIKSDPIRFLNSSTNIIVGRSLAERHGYKLHDKIALATTSGTQEFEIWGFIENKGVGRAFGGALAIMYYPAMQVAFGRGQNIDRIDIAIERGQESAVVTQNLKKVLGDAFTVDAPASRGDRVTKMLASINMTLTMASAIALIVGMFLIYNTMSISIVQRKRELGIMRALGATRREMIRLLTLEGLVLGIVGSAVGVATGLAMSRGMLKATSQAVSELYLQVAASEVQIEPRQLAFAFVLGVLAATIATAIPARRAGKVPPVQSLRSGGVAELNPGLHGITRLDILGIVCAVASYLLLQVPPVDKQPLGAFGASLTLLLAGAFLFPRLVQTFHQATSSFGARVLGLEATMAAGNLPRDIGRTTATGSALMVGVAMATAFAAFSGSFVTSLVGWAGQSFPGDLLVTASAALSSSGSKNVPMADTLRVEFEKYPEVDAIRRVRFAQVDYQGAPIRLASSDLKVYAARGSMTALEGSWDDMVPKLLNGAVIVSENFARRFDVHVGQQIDLSGKAGSHSYEVAGVVVDYTHDVGTVILDRATYINGWGDERVDTYELFLKPDADAEVVRRRISERYGQQYDLFVLTNADFRGEISKVADQIFSLMHVIDLIAIIVAALGIVNAMLASVLDRVREVGVMRAIGMLRRQARKVVMFEAAMVGGLGVVAGIIVGLALGYILLANINVVQMGWFFPYRPSWSAVAQMAVLVVFVSALAGWYPARLSANMAVADSLDYE